MKNLILFIALICTLTNFCVAQKERTRKRFKTNYRSQKTSHFASAKSPMTKLGGQEGEYFQNLPQTGGLRGQYSQENKRSYQLQPQSLQPQSFKSYRYLSPYQRSIGLEHGMSPGTHSKINASSTGYSSSTRNYQSTNFGYQKSIGLEHGMSPGTHSKVIEAQPQSYKSYRYLSPYQRSIGLEHGMSPGTHSASYAKYTDVLGE